MVVWFPSHPTVPWHTMIARFEKKVQKKYRRRKTGVKTKGVSSQRIAIDSFAAGGVLDHYQLTSYLLRGDTLHHYGISSPLTSYSYFYEELLDWMVDRFAHQQDVGPLENLQEHLAESGIQSKH